MTVPCAIKPLNSTFTRFFVPSQRSFCSFTLFLCSVTPSTALIFTTIFTFFHFPLRKYGVLMAHGTAKFPKQAHGTAAGGEKR